MQDGLRESDPLYKEQISMGETVYAYGRVSTWEQNLDNKVSGKSNFVTPDFKFIFLN